ncbi:MAG: hypothetical protein K8R59_11525 [Thermoanaerobaculales bacterium]|nr:hypothetical protein [Thermoanaerobaculales bacterium]
MFHHLSFCFEWLVLVPDAGFLASQVVSIGCLPHSFCLGYGKVHAKTGKKLENIDFKWVVGVLAGNELGA